jgi:hypothetical protein
MTNRDLLKEAIADAKAVKETAIANAKAALEESFAPRMREMLAAKLAEMDHDDEKTEKVEEAYSVEEEETMKENYMEEKETMEEEKMEEELDLDALLKELEGMEENINQTGFPDKQGEHGNVAGQNVTEAEEMGEEEDEEIDLDNMPLKDLKSLIEDVIAELVAAGELEAGENFEGEEGEEEEEEEEGEDEAEMMMAEVKKMKKEMEEAKKSKEKAEKDLKEALDTVSTIKTELSEVNLFNAKLLYTNKIFKAKNLTESQKVKVLEAFDKATSIKETKLVFETLSEGLKEKKSQVNESLLRGSASKPSGVAEKKPILEVDNQFARWQKLAGIKN